MGIATKVGANGDLTCNIGTMFLVGATRGTSLLLNIVEETEDLGSQYCWMIGLIFGRLFLVSTIVCASTYGWIGACTFGLH